MQTAAYILPLAFIAMLACYWAYRAGQRDGRAQQRETEDEKEMEANQIEDRLRRDADFANRVRDRFTR